MIWRVVVIALAGLITRNSVQAIGEGVVDLNTVLGIFGGMANIFTNFNTTDVEIDRIMGKWHQMYKAAINFDVFQTNMYCHVAYFSRNKVMGPQGFSIEEAYHVIGKGGPIETYKRDVTRTGNGEYWMYTEEYFYPRQFFILKVGPNLTSEAHDASDEPIDDAVINNSTDDANITASIVNRLVQRRPPKPPSSASANGQYEYLIATDANRLALMVYSRDPVKFYETLDKELLKELQKGGFGGYVFWNQPVAIYQGADCYYPTEKEVFARRALKAGGHRQTAFAPSSISDQQQSPSPIQPPALSALLQQQQQQLLLQQQQQGGLQVPQVPLQQLFG